MFAKIFARKKTGTSRKNDDAVAARRSKVSKAVGLALLVAGLYLLVAFVSYLFTWSADHDKLFGKSLFEVALRGELALDNWLGRLGGILAHLFFYRGFGLIALMFAIASLAYGVHLLHRFPKRILREILHYGFFLLCWLPPVLTFLFGVNGFPWGGTIGFIIEDWMTTFLGNFGFAVLLVFVLLLYLVLRYDIALPSGSSAFVLREQIRRFFMLKDTDEAPQTQAEGADAVAGEENYTASPTAAGQTGEDSEEQGVSVELDTEIGSDETDTEKGKSGETDADSEDVALDIEEGVEEKVSNSKTAVTNENYDPTLDLPDYKYPPLDLLEEYGGEGISVNKEELEANKDQIIETLGNYKIKIDKIKATVGPTITLYEIVPAPGVRISKIRKLEDDIALSLAALGIRIIAPIPGKGTIGIEVPNQKKEIVSARAMLASEKFQQSTMELPITLGKTISNENFIADLAKMPHLLIAGATGQGKSVGINAFLLSLLYRKHPSQLKFVLIDPKKVELSLYQAIEKHFLATLPNAEESIITDTKKVVYTLNSLCIEMEARYELLKSGGVRGIREYNKKFVQRKLNPEKGHRFLPHIVMVIDEFADFIMTAGKEVEMPIGRLAQLARAVGIHLIIATQRPSVNIITGTIKANFPARIAFKVTSKVDSRTILDTSGAEQLIGSGDMLYSFGGEMVRLQCPFVDTPEVENVTEFIGDQRGYDSPEVLPEYEGEHAEPGEVDLDNRDDLFDEAAKVVVSTQQGSTSMLQRRFKLGYNRAGRIMDQLESAGIVGAPEGSKPREVMIHTEEELERFLQELN